MTENITSDFRGNFITDLFHVLIDLTLKTFTFDAILIFVKEVMSFSNGIAIPSTIGLSKNFILKLLASACFRHK